MSRAVLCTLLALFFLATSLPAPAQRTPGTHSVAPGSRANFASGFGRRGRSYSNHHYRRFSNSGYGFFPYLDPLDYEAPSPEPELAAPAPAPVVAQPEIPEPPHAGAKVIEVPGASSPANARAQVPAIFILTSGERVEPRRFLLTASNLSFSIDHQQRTIPLAMLDVEATIAANHDRGVDLRIPADRNEIFLSF